MRSNEKTDEALRALPILHDVEIIVYRFKFFLLDPVFEREVNLISPFC